MAQQQQIPYINMSQTQKQNEKERLLKLYPKKLSMTFSILQLVFGVFAIFWQVSLSKDSNLCLVFTNHIFLQVSRPILKLDACQKVTKPQCLNTRSCSKNHVLYFQIVEMAYSGHRYYSFSDKIGWGIWTGLTFCLSGGIGLIGSVRPSLAT